MVARKTQTFPDLVDDQVAAIRAIGSPMTHPLQGWAYLQEDLDDLWEAIKRRSVVAEELVALAATAQRVAEDGGTCPFSFPKYADLVVTTIRQEGHRIGSLHEGYARLRCNLSELLFEIDQCGGAQLPHICLKIAATCRIVAEDCRLIEPEGS